MLVNLTILHYCCGLKWHVVEWRKITRNHWILESIMEDNIKIERKSYQGKTNKI